MTITQRIRETCKKYPGLPALYSKDASGEFQVTTFRDLYQEIQTAGAGFLSAGVKKGDHVGIISDNMRKWIIADLALLGIGAADVPRGSDTTAVEAAFILDHADCSAAVAQDSVQAMKILEKKDALPALKKIILFNDDRDKINAAEGGAVEVLNWNEIMEAGKEKTGFDPDFFDRQLEAVKGDDIATIIYTSGTTGMPKGVMLTHDNFIFQLDRINGKYLIINPGDIMVSILPVWHSFERACEYIFLEAGGAIAYSEPAGTVLIPDMAKLKPQWIVSVPRVWEGVRGAVIRKLKQGSKIKKPFFTSF